MQHVRLARTHLSFGIKFKCEDESAINVGFIGPDFECAPIALDRLTRKSQIKKRTGKGHVNGGVIAVADERAPITFDRILLPVAPNRRACFRDCKGRQNNLDRF